MEIIDVRCEVVAIGTELLLGIINDTNSSWIGEQLALSGIDSHFQVKVGDNFQRMETCIREALERSDAVICCGGLGPTQDDITRDVIAHIMGKGMARDDAIAAEIRRRFEARGRTMSANNLRQADVPVGASPIAQMPGTAPGLVCPIDGKVIYAVPGVPSEMRMMMEGTILPDLRARSGETRIIHSRVLRCWGISESGLAEMLSDRISALDESGRATLAFQASGIEGIKVRITAKSSDEAATVAILDEEEAHIRPLLTDAIFGVDDETMEVAVLKQLRAQSLTLAATETLTGGTLSSRMTVADPELQTFRGGIVIPNPDAATVDHGESSEQRAFALAEKARQLMVADIGLAAVTPSIDDSAKPGTVIAAASIEGQMIAQSFVLFSDQTRLRNYSVISALDFLRKTLAHRSGSAPR
ncbi:MAG: CinA family nicotinamide mononucleotide deamidase-related protein [Hyphomicrobiaceae bacterium]